jgi:hypothetical protein
MQSSPLPCYLVPLGPKYPPQHFILKNPQHTFFLQMSDHVSHPYKRTGKIITLHNAYTILMKKPKERDKFQDTEVGRKMLNGAY